MKKCLKISMSRYKLKGGNKPFEQRKFQEYFDFLKKSAFEQMKNNTYYYSGN